MTYRGPWPSLTATIWLKYLILAKTKFYPVALLEKKKIDCIMEKRGKILKWINYFIGSKYSWAFPPYSLNYVECKEFPGSSDGKESPPMQKMWIRSLNWEDPLEEKRVTHSSILA